MAASVTHLALAALLAAGSSGVMACAPEASSSLAAMAPVPVAAASAREKRGAGASVTTETCPLTLDGVRADIETTGGGATITLASAPDQVMLLRARSKDVAAMDGGLLAACPCPAMESMDAKRARARPPIDLGADAGAGAAASAHHGLPPSADVAVEDTDDGVRIVLTARDPSDARRLAARVRGQLTLVHAGECAPSPAAP